MGANGVVLKSTGKWYKVEMDDGQLVDCRIRGRMRLEGLKTTNPIAVGDRVVVSEEEDKEGNRIISDFEKRRNYIVRKSINLSKQQQILAANIDRAYLMITIHSPVTHLAFIDRFLVSAESFRIPVTLLFNKADLYNEDDHEYVDALIQLYNRIGYPGYKIQADNPDSVTFLKDEIKDKQVMISGHSGVGKSTLLNSLDPSLNIKTSEISEAHQQGQHTTTFAEMHKLSSGGYFIDTPGIRAFGVIDLEKEHIAHYFPEMRRLLGKCKFNNCMHLQEPECAVKEAVGDGDILETRYQSYVRLMEEDQSETYRKNIY